MGIAPKSVKERLDEKLIPEPNTGCHLWTGGINKWGYGRSRVPPRRANMKFTHRVSWELANGPIPRDLLVLHKCDVPSCCNPDHMYLGTSQDNRTDAQIRHRANNRKSGMRWAYARRGRWRSIVHARVVAHYLRCYSSAEEAQEEAAEFVKNNIASTRIQGRD